MFDLANPLRLQQAMAKGAMQAMEMVAVDAVRMLRGQGLLLHDDHTHRRSEDETGHAKPVCSGADLMDHYGRRHHDVDVEHSI